MEDLSLTRETAELIKIIPRLRLRSCAVQYVIARYSTQKVYRPQAGRLRNTSCYNQKLDTILNQRGAVTIKYNNTETEGVTRFDYLDTRRATC